MDSASRRLQCFAIRIAQEIYLKTWQIKLSIYLCNKITPSMQAMVRYTDYCNRALKILQSHPDSQERIVRIELAYYRDTRNSEVIYNATLFKINKVAHLERLTTFCVLLQGFSYHRDTKLPLDTDTLTVLQGEIIPGTPSEDEVVVNEL